MSITHGQHELDTCDLRLQALINAVARQVDVEVVQGHRSHEQAMQNVASGHSHTLHSKHEANPSLAVDVGPAGMLAAWTKGHDLPGEAYVKLSNIVLSEAKKRGIKIRWGGDWDMKGDGNKQGQLNDLVHYEIMEG